MAVDLSAPSAVARRHRAAMWTTFVLGLTTAVATWGTMSPFGVYAGIAIGLVLLVAGWPRLLDLPARSGVTAVLAVAAALTLVVVRVPDQPHPRELVAVAGGAMILLFLQQLARKDGRGRLVESYAGGLTAIVLVTLAGALGYQSGMGVATGIAAAVGISALADLAPGRGPWLGSLAAIVLGAVGWQLSRFPYGASLRDVPAAALTGLIAYLVRHLLAQTGRDHGLSGAAAGVASWFVGGFAGAVVHALIWQWTPIPLG